MKALSKFAADMLGSKKKNGANNKVKKAQQKAPIIGTAVKANSLASQSHGGGIGFQGHM